MIKYDIKTKIETNIETVEDFESARNKLKLADEKLKLTKELNDTNQIYLNYLEEIYLNISHEKTEQDIMQILNERNLKKRRIKEIESLS